MKPPFADALVRRRQPLVAQHSESRSPRRLFPVSEAVAPVATNATEPRFVALPVRHVATIKGPVDRSELEDVIVFFEVMDFFSGRWICRVNGGGKLRILRG